MKKVFAMLLVAAMAACVSSCGDSTVLSKSAAKKAINKEAMFAKDYAVGTFETGYYEVNESALDRLAKLKAAGVVDYSTETVVEKARKRTYDYWRGYTYYTVDVEHTFASVSLTEEGKKLVVENPTTMRSDIAKDFAANENFVEATPPYMDAMAEEPTQEEITVVEDVSVTADSVAVDSVVVMAEEAVVEEEKPAAGPADPNAAFNAAMARVSSESHNVLLGCYKLEKVKQVRCTEEMAKNGVGSCMALITFADKTPFGFVLGAPKQGYIMSAEVKFEYYNDLGWVVSGFSD